MIYHPHIHYIVPGVSLSSDHKRFIKFKNNRFLIHAKPLVIRFKYLFQKALKETEFYGQIPKSVWEKDWVVHCEYAGSGKKIIKYVAPYVYRVAISNHRIIKIEDRKVTFWYKDTKTNEIKTCTFLNVFPEVHERMKQGYSQNLFLKFCFDNDLCNSPQLRSALSPLFCKNSMKRNQKIGLFLLPFFTSKSQKSQKMDFSFTKLNLFPGLLFDSKCK